MPTTNVVELTNEWEVLVRPVPPTASFKWQGAHIEFPPKPSRPVVSITSELTGHTEVVPALPGSTEWNRWAANMALWDDECMRLREESVYDEAEYSMDYSVVGWRKKGESKWQSDPPEEWERPAALDRHGVKPHDIRRLDFIQYELLETPEDMARVSRMSFPGGERDTSPVTDEEVTAVLQSFPFRDGGAAGHLGDIAGAGGQRHSDVPVRGGDVDSRRRTSFVRRVVQLFKGRQNSDAGRSQNQGNDNQRNQTAGG